MGCRLAQERCPWAQMESPVGLTRVAARVRWSRMVGLGPVVRAVCARGCLAAVWPPCLRLQACFGELIGSLWLSCIPRAGVLLALWRPCSCPASWFASRELSVLFPAMMVDLELQVITHRHSTGLGLLAAAD